MKKKINLFVLLLVLISIPKVILASDSYYINYYGVDMTEEEYLNLLELGFSEEEIYYLDEVEFNNNRNVEGSLEAESINYYVNIIRYDSIGRVVSNTDMQISEDDYYGEEILPYTTGGYIETTYKQMRTTIAAAGSYYRYKVTLTWKQMPAVRSYDIIAIGIEPSVQIVANPTFNQTYCVNTSCTNTSAINNRVYDNTGGGASFALPTSTSITSLRQTLYFDVQKRGSSILNEMYAYGDYAHAVKTIGSNAATGYDINQAGIILSSSIANYYDTINTADAVWTGSW